MEIIGLLLIPISGPTVPIIATLFHNFDASMQDVTEDWPLTVVDFNFKSKNVTLKPGEMVLYESAKMPHGRQFPLNGNYFDNVFVHFRSNLNQLNLGPVLLIFFGIDVRLSNFLSILIG